MKGRFEWHITTDRKHAATLKRIAEHSRFTFSQISGCPILGQGTYAYLTGYSTNSKRALDEVLKTVKLLQAADVDVLRAKIENIVFDTKTHVNRITPWWRHVQVFLRRFWP